MKIFSGSSNKPLAQKIAQHLNISLSPLEIHIFPDGERRIMAGEKVLDEDVVVVQSTSTPVDQNYMELFFICDSMKRSGARTVTVVMPYVGYQRQDHVFRDGEAVSLDVVIRALESTGTNRVIAFDFHSIKIPELFKIPVTHLSALPLFAETIKERGWGTSESFLVSPDLGGLRRIKIISGLLEDMPFLATVKNRDLESGVIEIEEIEGDTNIITKKALIVDDMISSGKTIVESAKLLKKQGVEEVNVFVTHAIFSENAPKLLQESEVDNVFVTDSVFIPEEKRFEKLTILSIAGAIAKELKNNS